VSAEDVTDEVIALPDEKPLVSSSSPVSQLKTSGYVHAHSSKPYSNHKPESYESIVASTIAVLTSVALLGVRFALSALFWDRSVHAYEDLLDSPAKSQIHQVNLKSQLSFKCRLFKS
jgi:hypothetical protein